MKLTVFTPTYNRAYILGKLYESLCRQTAGDFEWIVVDDGSTDGTEALVRGWSSTAPFSLRYVRQANGGKHRAINRAVREARGELFFIVDSDDYLADNAVERVLSQYDTVRGREDFAGVCGMKVYPDGHRVGGDAQFTVLECSFFEFRDKHRIQGDLAEVYRTDVMRQFPFPEIPGEKFCPEVLVWTRIAMKYKLRFFNEPIYICDYLPDGLTQNSLRHRVKSPGSCMLAYEAVYLSPRRWKRKYSCAISYWCFYFLGGRRLNHKGRVPWLFTVPGWLLAQRRKRYVQ